MAKRAVASYLKSIHLMKDKTVFKLDAIDREKLAKSFGLLNAPQIEIISKKDKPDRIALLREKALERKLAKKKVEPESSEDDFFQAKA